MLNKKGSEKYLSIWNIIVWILVAGIIIAGLTIFRNTKIEVRNFEAEVLAKRVSDCLIQNGVIIPEFFSKEFNLFEKCSLNQKIIETEEYYLSISLVELTSGNQIKEPINFGNPDLSLQCQLKKTEEKFAECYYEKSYARDSEISSAKDVLLQITTGSNYPGGTNA